jgi:pyruvate formate lyase activating enzyme
MYNKESPQSSQASKCFYCQKESILISSELKLCADCICSHFDEVKSQIDEVHKHSRLRYNLLPVPPKSKEGIKCDICVNECQVSEGEKGYCAYRHNENGKFSGGNLNEGNFSWYHDNLPTNCVANWVCPGCTECGHPKYSYAETAEYGYKNLAVFFNSCTFNCLFCQNWHYREETTKPDRLNGLDLINAVDEKTSCICYFGGEPTPQLPFAIEQSKQILQKNESRILRICWETNGTMNTRLLEEMTDLSLKSGGCIKMEIKAWHEELNIALCGITNKQTLVNFESLAKLATIRPEPPLLVASTLLIPGYISEEEIGKIAKFIASLNPYIPYTLLAFSPHFYMWDLPTTSRRHALKCLMAAYEAGLKRVMIGNVNLLGDAY